ncbi:25S rRNA (adenine645-N1)-methyltransferase [Cadophora gregata]|uniref:25S rRNA (adenine645-N1)-methyltransferase n=1 Tax=Cadophora gregata TaxID=51156 RepID=UPI0026DD04BC|nr:25S rRNA (adenine645-N1)-methyltransferase [Cadophora gregata]KAK0118193.1 25S rRNA (adenine645-N1)-methyltransferase [Cadophora gregata]KAK0123266.1 25S rRNA (adenine645-N1)-methyltransferase [Cadophora gregata f. sp. sojae]
MFAVPGWSVSSSLLKAEKPEGSKSVAKVTDPEAVIEGESKKSSKKRKRNAAIEKNGPKNVDVNNMEELWETVIEGKPKEKKHKQKHGEKKQKVADEDMADDVADGQEDKASSGHKSKDGKKPWDSGSADEAKDPEEAGTKAAKDRVKKGKTMKEKKREKKAKLKALADGTAPDQTNTTTTTSDSIKGPAPKATAPQPPKPTLTPLQASMRQKLISARFRHLNQTLYTTPSAHSLSLFAENPEMFTEYHEGFRRQVEVWPENPVDGYLSQILSRGPIRGPSRGNPLDKTKEQALPRTEGTCVLADLGCGDAALATSLQPHLKKLKLKIHSFDLQSPSPLVTKADIANLPLKDGTVDIAIFCLALMGTNWVDFIEEAYRILRWKGELWIAEIKSRFGRVSNAGAGSGNKKVVEHSVGNRKRPLDKKAKKAADEAADDEVAAIEVDGQEDRGGETDVSAFVEVLRKRGFVLRGEGQGGEKASVDLSNKMFVRMCFVKGTTPIKGKCVPAPKGAEEFAKGGVKGGETWKRKAPKGKFGDEKGEEDDVHVSSEAKVLKPCVYKLR